VTFNGGVQGKVIGVLGGTGPQGKGLARRFAAGGVDVVIGSRDADRAKAVAEQLGSGVRGASNRDCAEVGDVVIVAVPWEGHAELLTALRDDLRDTIVVDCVNPLGFDHQGAYLIDVPEGSAAQQAQSLLPQARVVAAFHHVSAAHLNDLELDSVDCDVLVIGDDRAATDVVRALVDVIPGMRGIFAGRLRNAASVEGLTANLIAVNRRYRTSAGVRVTGL
jgi:8-hydroxy-5-deazaflavin:NADPH oxidoreductase